MRLSVIFVAVLLSAPFTAQAQSQFGDRRLAMIEDPLQVTFAGDPARLTRQQMRQAIELAALVREWRIVNVSDEKFELSTTRNGRHVLHVMVLYTAAGFEIRYIDSVDMMYGEARDQGRAVRVIHRNYNAWIRQLAETASNRIGLAARVSAPAAVSAQPSPQQPTRPAFSTRFDSGADRESAERRPTRRREEMDMR